MSNYKNIIMCIFIIIPSLIFSSNNINDPVSPNEPKISELDTKSEKKEEANIEFQYQNGKFGKGITSGLGGRYLELTWEGNELGAQEILFDFVRSIRIKAYTMVKKSNDNLGIVFYFPHIFDIELKDGTYIKDAKGRIKEIESFSIYNNIGRQKCYSYFIRYWMEDKRMFSDNMSIDYNETPKVPDSLVIYLEFKD